MTTPQQAHSALATALGTTAKVYLKREDKHPYGSHKGRSIPHMIECYVAQGKTSFAISSSGNAALAAIHAVLKSSKPLSLAVYIGEHINDQKLSDLQKLAQSCQTISIHQVKRPKQVVFQLAQQNKATSLRQSTDDSALNGYESLAKELLHIPQLQAVFIPTSSGTTAQALGKYFQTNNKSIQIHIVQTTSCHPIAQHFDETTNDEPSLATAIVDAVAKRKKAVIDMVTASHGSGWTITNQEITAAQELIHKTSNLDLSPTSVLSVAGLQKALQHNWSWDGAVACLITGK